MREVGIAKVLSPCAVVCVVCVGIVPMWCVSRHGATVTRCYVGVSTYDVVPAQVRSYYGIENLATVTVPPMCLAFGFVPFSLRCAAGSSFSIA